MQARLVNILVWGILRADYFGRIQMSGFELLLSDRVYSSIDAVLPKLVNRVELCVFSLVDKLDRSNFVQSIDQHYKRDPVETDRYVKAEVK